MGAPEPGDEGSEDDSASVDVDLQPTGRGARSLDNFAGPDGQGKPTGQAGSGNTTYHGGPVMTSPIKIYYIWYGNWSGNTATTILTDLANSIGGSGYFNINTTYTNGSGTKVSSTATFGGSYNDNYSKGTSLSDNAIKTIVTNSIGAAPKLPSDANGVYFVLTSADVNATSGFCTQYCGWHTYASIGGKQIKYSFIGNPDRCPQSCEMYPGEGPNGNPGADGMASILAHELEEAATDPQLNAWYDAAGYENADKCAWTFGSTYAAANGATANMKLGARDYLIQQNWVNGTGQNKCAKSYP